MKKYTEKPESDENLKLIEACTRDCLPMLGLNEDESPENVISAIDQYVFDWQRGNLADDNKTDPDDAPYLLGALWGAQMVNQFGWHWGMLVYHEYDDSAAPAVISPDASLVIHPFHFIMGCLQDPEVDCTIALAWNMLVADKVSGLEPNGYYNLMDGVMRIVPR